MAASLEMENEVLYLAKDRYLGREPKNPDKGRFSVGANLLAVVPGYLNKLYALSTEYEHEDMANVYLIYWPEDVKRRYFRENGNHIIDPTLPQRIGAILGKRTKVDHVRETLKMQVHIPLQKEVLWDDGRGNPTLFFNMEVDPETGEIKADYRSMRKAPGQTVTEERYLWFDERRALTDDDLKGIAGVLKAMKPEEGEFAQILRKAGAFK